MTHRDPQVEVFSESDCRITFFYIITIFLTVVILLISADCVCLNR